MRFRFLPTVLLGLLLLLPSAAAAAAPVELVETWPVETDLDHPEIPDAHEVWLEMIQGAEKSLDFAEFYASSCPESLLALDPEVNGRLEEVVRAVEAAAARGVKVHFLADAGFYRTYPATLDRLASHDGIEVRREGRWREQGGVLHAKYFVVDGKEAYLGSQNFDWRSLAHIQELGLRLRDPGLVGALHRVFLEDWARVKGQEPPAAGVLPALPAGYRPAFSPRGELPDPGMWDLPRLIGLIDSAEQRVRVQLLSYKAAGRDGRYWSELEDALRRAAARGVRVEMILSHWSKRPSTIAGLKSLQCLDGITVKLATIPEWSKGYIPFARVVHAKYLVVDGRRGWVGTSNWSRDYFYDSRNVGVVLEDATVAERLDGFFESLWAGPYVETVDPGRTYERPHYGE